MQAPKAYKMGCRKSLYLPAQCEIPMGYSAGGLARRADQLASPLHVTTQGIDSHAKEPRWLDHLPIDVADPRGGPHHR